MHTYTVRGEQGGLRADSPCHRPECKRARHAYELDKDEGGNLRVPIDTNFDAVNRRHPDDGLDPVVVEH
jgi:hypothetical protein